jgi:hypothetical protein
MWCPLPRTVASALRRCGANRLARAVLVVSHHLDGFLHLIVCRLVASCFRPWGSSGFSPACLPQTVPPRRCSCPPERSPDKQRCRASPQARAPSPFTRCFLVRPRGFLPLANPLCPPAVADPYTPVALMGFPSGAAHPLSLAPCRLAPSRLRQSMHRGASALVPGRSRLPVPHEAVRPSPRRLPCHVYGWLHCGGSLPSRDTTLADASALAALPPADTLRVPLHHTLRCSVWADADDQRCARAFSPRWSASAGGFQASDLPARTTEVGRP